MNNTDRDARDPNATCTSDGSDIDPECRRIDNMNARSWNDFIPPALIASSHPWVSRYNHSAILNYTTGSDLVSTTDKEIYGNQIHPIAFRIGNGGAGYTGILKVLCLKFISTHGDDFQIAWVSNHSRHTQAALLADIVQVALTYEPDVEELTVQEDWCKRVCKSAFWDHFILVGPSVNPAGVAPGSTASEALRAIAKRESLFHTRGDGSATFERELKLWRDAGVQAGVAPWLQTYAVPPYAALEGAAKHGAYLLIDRATFLTAKKDGIVEDLVVYVEGGKELLNPCSALVNTKVSHSPAQELANSFAEWLGGDDAQSIIRGYGRVWALGMPLFTGAEQEDFADEEMLAGGIL